jgi:hypothetical protein
MKQHNRGTKQLIGLQPQQRLSCELKFFHLSVRNFSRTKSPVKYQLAGRLSLQKNSSKPMATVVNENTDGKK